MTTASSETSEPVGVMNTTAVTPTMDSVLVTTEQDNRVKNIGMIVGISVAAGIVLLVGVILVVYVCRRKARRQKRSRKELPIPSEIDRPHLDQLNEANDTFPESHKVHKTENVPFTTTPDRSCRTPAEKVNEDPAPPYPPRLPEVVGTDLKGPLPSNTNESDNPSEVYIDMSSCLNMNQAGNAQRTPRPHKAKIHSYINTGEKGFKHNPDLKDETDEDYENQEVWREHVVSRSTSCLHPSGSTKPAFDLKKIVPFDEAENCPRNHSYYNQPKANDETLKPTPRYINACSFQRL